MTRSSGSWTDNDYLLNAKVVVVNLGGVSDGLPCDPAHLRNRRLGSRGVVHDCYGRYDGKTYWYVRSDDGFYSIHTQDELEPQDGYQEMRRVPGRHEPPQAAMYRWDATRRSWEPVSEFGCTVIRIGKD